MRRSNKRLAGAVSRWVNTAMEQGAAAMKPGAPGAPGAPGTREQGAGVQGSVPTTNTARVRTDNDPSGRRTAREGAPPARPSDEGGLPLAATGAALAAAGVAAAAAVAWASL